MIYLRTLQCLRPLLSLMHYQHNSIKSELSILYREINKSHVTTNQLLHLHKTNKQYNQLYLKQHEIYFKIHHISFRHVLLICIIYNTYFW